MPDPSKLTLRLLVDGKKQTVSLPAASTVAELYELAKRAILDAAPTLKRSKDDVNFELLSGFPPRPLISGDSSLQEAGVASMETITVKVQSKTKESVPKASLPSPRQKRAAAVKATEGFKDAIAREEELLNKSMQKSTQTPCNPSKKPKFTAASTAGYRLADGQMVCPSRPRAPPRSKAVVAKNGTEELDSSVQFLSSATSNSRTKDARLMRRGWRQAVNDAYEQNKAVARLAAIASNKYTFSLVEDGKEKPNVGVYRPKTLLVTFDKGVQGRGEFAETVDYLPKTALSTALGSIHASHADALRPENMALLSPRVLWSLMYHYQRETDESQLSHVVAAMKQLQPDLDWSFLRRRKEQLSAKARENLRQAEEAKVASAARKGVAVDTDMDEWARAADAIASVERAMEDMHVTGRTRPMIYSTPKMEPWFVETPDEFDSEELHTCVAAQPPADATKDWVKLLHQDCGVHNWRELANQSATELCKALCLDEEICQAWIDFAQTESVDEIVVEICGSVDAVEILRESANSGTPRDLASWRSAISLLAEVIDTYYAERRVTYSKPTIEDLQTWCNRAHQACEQLPWLRLFATDVSAQYGDTE